MMRYLLLFLLVAPVLAQESGGAAGADPARLFPKDTFLYAETDFGAFEKALPEWQIAKILADPAIKKFLKPTLVVLDLDPEKPLESLLERFPPRALFEGRAAIGVRGISIVVRDDRGREWRFRVSPEAPLDARAMFRHVGMMLAMESGVKETTIDIDVDFLAVGKPGRLGKGLVEAALSEFEGKVTRTAVKVGGRDATHVRSDVDTGWGLKYAFNFYAVEESGTWYLASHTDTLEQALGGGPRGSLAESASLQQARARFTGGVPVLLAYVDFGTLFDAYKGFIPPIAAEMADIAGVSAIRGLGFGISLVDGGVRESLGIVLDGNPRGFWKILEGMPGGFRSLEVAPPGALAAFGVKLDMTVLRDRIRAFCAEVMPGNEEEIEREIAREMAPGFDLVADVLPALGDEVAVFVYPAGTNEMFPRFVLGVDGRDEAALAKLVAKVQEQIPARGAQFTPVEVAGVAAVRVFVEGTPYEIHYAIHKRHLFVASNPRLLADVLTQWGAEGRPSLLRDDPMFSAVLKATNGGDAASLAALGYVNLRGCGMEALKTANMWGQLLPGEWFDLTASGAIARIPNHLTGAALAMRHDKMGVVLDCYSPVGFLVPSAIALAAGAAGPVMVQAVAPMPQAGAGRASLGIRSQSKDGSAVKVLGLFPGGPAATAGFLQGDRIVGFDGVAITSIEDLSREVSKKRPGDSVVVKVLRGDKEIALTVELGDEGGIGG